MILLNRYIRPAIKLCFKKVYCFYKRCLLSCKKTGWPSDCSSRQLIFMIAGLLLLIVYFNKTALKETNLGRNIICRRNCISNTTRDIDEYKYMLINNTEVTMKRERIKHLHSSYAWFESMKHLFKNLGEEEAPVYPKGTPLCKVDMSSLDKNRPDHLPIFLYYIHRLLKKHMLEYRIFIIEQFGTEMFNRGKLFNIAYLESQRFGTWDCLIFHDVDAIPEDDRIIYNCSRSPFHLASAIDEYNYKLRYEEEFGGVTALTPAHFEAVNGYSNFYWSWGGEDDDMSARLKFMNLKISRYNNSISRFSTLPHAKHAAKGQGRVLFLLLCRQRFQIEGLKTTNYKLISVEKKNMFTHIVADVNPDKLKLDEKNLLRQMIHISGGDMYGNRMTFLIHKVTKPALPSKPHNNRTLENSKRQTLKHKDVKLN